MATARVILRPRKARPFYGRHPWVLDTAVAHIDGSPADGDVVELIAENGKFVARGIFSSQSRIRVRLLTWNPTEAINDDFLRQRLQAALQLRRALGFDRPDGAARQVFSEADGLTGLIVDRYGPYLAVQVNAHAMALRLPALGRQCPKPCGPITASIGWQSICWNRGEFWSRAVARAI